MSECVGRDFRLSMGNIFSQPFWTQAAHSWDSHYTDEGDTHRPSHWCSYLNFGVLSNMLGCLISKIW